MKHYRLLLTALVATTSVLVACEEEAFCDAQTECAVQIVACEEQVGQGLSLPAPADELVVNEEGAGFEKQQDLVPQITPEAVAALQGEETNVEIQIEKGISLEEAIAIAENNDEIACFVRCKADCVVIAAEAETQVAAEVVLEEGDTLFFKQTETLSFQEAPGIADTYVKVTSAEQAE